MNFSKIDKKWQRKWEQSRAFKVKEGKGKKYYVLEMYPYPSATGLHVGHAFNYKIGDIYARFKRMNGFNVLHPMGYDSFGLPAENAAIKAKVHPKKYSDNAIKNFINQQKSLGFSYDWGRTLKSHDENYYKWNQYFFLKFLEKGLAYRKKAPVNWCSKCETVLANEQVRDGRCWRHSDVDVEIKQIEQWFLKTTDYADKLLNGLEKLDWPDRIKIMQKNWIGKSTGTEIIFKILGKPWKIFTTRPDTLMGVTFMVVSAQHPELMGLVKEEQKKEVRKFLDKIKSTKQEDIDLMEKQGVFTGSYAEHPITRDKIPVYAGNFVIAEYGSGMVMAVPGHDQRDFEFAKKYKIPIKTVINEYDLFGEINNVKKEVEKEFKQFYVKYESKAGKYFIKGVSNFEEELLRNIQKHMKDDSYGEIYTGKQVFILLKNKLLNISKNVKAFEDAWKEIDKLKIKLDLDKVRKKWENFFEKAIANKKSDRAYDGPGYLINSGKFDGLFTEDAKAEITNTLKDKNLGKSTTEFKLRDWLISRQRYWGTPIPVIYCDGCGIVPVPEKDLPVKLPEKVKFGQGNPLASSKEFTKALCPKCKKVGKRETDTMDTFFDSSWYYLRYTDSKNKKLPFDKAKARYWMPVDFYTGGAEHACMHLIYARFFSKALSDFGFVSFDEPFLKLFNQGMVHGEDGYVMAKSRGNVINPLDIGKKYGSDALRLFLVSNAYPEKDFAWSKTGLESTWKFVKKVYDFYKKVKPGKSDRKTEHKVNKTIKEFTSDIKNFAYNLAVIKIKNLFSYLEKGAGRKDLESFLKLFSLFCPHISEELWNRSGNKKLISLERWPSYDAKKIDERFEEAEKAVEKVVSDIGVILRMLNQKGKRGKKVYVYVLPNEADNYNEKELGSRVGVEVKIYAVNDKKKYDPKGKSSKAKPGKPGIFVE